MGIGLTFSGGKALGGVKPATQLHVVPTFKIKQSSTSSFSLPRSAFLAFTGTTFTFTFDACFAPSYRCQQGHPSCQESGHVPVGNGRMLVKQQCGGGNFEGLACSRLRLKCDGTRAETRFRLSAKRTSTCKSAGASVQSTTDSRGVRISGSNAVYTMLRFSVKSTGYPLHSPVFPSLPLPCVTVCHHISPGLYSVTVTSL